VHATAQLTPVSDENTSEDVGAESVTGVASVTGIGVGVGGCTGVQHAAVMKTATSRNSFFIFVLQL
jgi:hypothetical protein